MESIIVSFFKYTLFAYLMWIVTILIIVKLTNYIFNFKKSYYDITKNIGILLFSVIYLMILLFLLYSELREYSYYVEKDQINKILAYLFALTVIQTIILYKTAKISVEKFSKFIAFALVNIFTPSVILITFYIIYKLQNFRY